jgi:hypothetical protein
VIKKGEHGAPLFHDKEVFFAPVMPLEEVLIQQEILLQADLQIYYTKRKRFIRKHEKRHYIWSNLASSVWRNLGQKEWLI